MKKLKRLLLVVTLVGLLCLSAAFTALAIGEGEYTGSMDKLNTLVAELDIADKWTAVDAVDDYLKATPVDPSSEGYAEAMAKVYAAAVAYANERIGRCGDTSTNADWATAYTEGARLLSRFPEIDDTVAGYTDYLAVYTPERCLEIAEACLAEVDIANGTAKNGVALNRVTALVKACPVMVSAEGYAEFMADLAEQTKLQEDEMARLLEELNSANTLDNYDLEVLIKDYVSALPNAKPELHGFVADINVNSLVAPSIGNNTVSRVTGEDGEDYLYFELYNSAHSYVRTDLPEYQVGTVIEFDISTIGHMPEGGIEIASSSKVDAAGVRYNPGYGGFEANGSFYAKSRLEGAGNSTVLEGAVVPGEWIHISIIFNPDTGKLSYYVNYEYMGTCDGTAGVAGHNFHCFRIGSINTTDKTGGSSDDASYDGDFALRNFTVYQGNSIRVTDYISSMSGEERFTFFCNYLLKNDEDGADAKSIKVAYDIAKESVDVYRADAYLDNADIQTAIEIYDAFDYDTFITEYRLAVLNDFHTSALELSDAERTLDTIASRWTLLDGLDKYLDEEQLGQYIDKNSAEYSDAMNSMQVFRNNLEMDEKIISFINSVNRFDNAMGYNASTEALKKHYNNAASIYVELDKTLIGVDGYERYTKANESYCSALARLEQQERIGNSKTIVDCVAYIQDYTEEQWRDEANFEYIDRFVTIVRRTVNEGKYDPDYEGVSEALQVYAPINEYYYSVLQDKHASVISEQLENYRSSSEYIEMLGICAYVSNYLDDPANDIDRLYPEIAALISELEVYKTELRAREADYEEALNLNTRYFINAVERMTVATTYGERKALFEEASLYYYNMNIGDSGVAERIAIYEATKVELERALEASVAFVDSVSLYIVAEDDDEKFDALVVCYYYVQSATESIDGVSESLEIFLAAVEEYLSRTDTANAEMLEAGMLMASVGGKGGAAPILSAALKLIFD